MKAKNPRLVKSSTVSNKTGGNVSVIDLRQPPLDKMHFRDPLSEMIWWNEKRKKNLSLQLSLLRRWQGKSQTHIISNSKIAFFRLLENVVPIFVSQFQVEMSVRFSLNWISVPFLNVDAFTVLPLVFFYSVSCQSNDIWEKQTLRCSLHFVANFLMCQCFQTDVMPRFEKSMHFVWKHGDNLAKNHEHCISLRTDLDRHRDVQREHSIEDTLPKIMVF